MGNKKLLYVLIPLIIIVLILIAGVIYLQISTNPQKIFEKSIDKAFKMFENAEEQYATMNGTMNFTLNFENKNDKYTEIYGVLEASNIGLSMELDTKNMIVNENLNVTHNNENLINATILLQDEKVYVYLADFLDKYLQIPQEEIDTADFINSYKKSATLDQNKLIEAIKEELIVAISNQKLVQENATLFLNGQETKVTASMLSLKDEQINAFFRDFLSGLNQNEKFLLSLGDYKDDIITELNKTLQNLGDTDGEQLVFTIYTKGFFNEFVGVSGKILDTYSGEKFELNLLKHNNKYNFTIYQETDEERAEILNLSCENQGNQTVLNGSTEKDDTDYTFSANIIQNGQNYNGNLDVSFEISDIGIINANYSFDFTFGVEIQKADVQNAVLIDELSEDDQKEFMTNFQKSKLYEMVEQVFGINLGNDKAEVTSAGHTVTYNIPTGFVESANTSEKSKEYTDNNSNLVNVSINKTSVATYMNDLDNKTSNYENKKISNTKKYTVNDKEYKFRTVTYTREATSYVDLYFAYELDEKHCYVIEVQSKGGKMSMDTIKTFLDVNVLFDMNSLLDNVVEETNDAIKKEENLASGRVIMNGVWYDSIDDYINGTPSANQET